MLSENVRVNLDLCCLLSTKNEEVIRPLAKFIAEASAVRKRKLNSSDWLLLTNRFVSIVLIHGDLSQYCIVCSTMSDDVKPFCVNWNLTSLCLFTRKRAYAIYVWCA